MKKLLLLLAVATMTVGNAGCQCGPLRLWWKCINEDKCDAPAACGTCCPGQGGYSGYGEGVITSPPIISPGPIVQ